MPRTRITRVASALAALTAATLIFSACSKVDEGAEEGSSFPEKDIRLIIQANPGGGSDLSSRALATELEKSLGVNVIPENMPGAAGALAMEYVGSQNPDGYVIGFAPVEIAMLNTTQGANVLPENYDLIGQIMLAPGVITVSSSSNIESLDQLIEQAKAGSVTVANAGAGSIWEAATLGLGSAVDVTFTPVPYDGGAPAVSAAASGETVAAVSGLGEALAQGDAVRILAVMHSERHPDAEDVATVEELTGVEVEFGGWGGIYAPKDLPDEVREKLEAAVEEAVESDTYQKFQKDAGNLVVYRNAEDFSSFVSDQFTLFADLLG